MWPNYFNNSTSNFIKTKIHKNLLSTSDLNLDFDFNFDSVLF